MRIIRHLIRLFLCCSDANGVVLKPEDYQVHEVSSALKRFFRLLDEPLMSESLYVDWIKATSEPCRILSSILGYYRLLGFKVFWTLGFSIDSWDFSFVILDC